MMKKEEDKNEPLTVSYVYDGKVLASKTSYVLSLPAEKYDDMFDDLCASLRSAYVCQGVVSINRSEKKGRHVIFTAPLDFTTQERQRPADNVVNRTVGRLFSEFMVAVEEVHHENDK